jgi:hypothetical protein
MASFEGLAPLNIYSAEAGDQSRSAICLFAHLHAALHMRGAVFCAGAKEL